MEEIRTFEFPNDVNGQRQKVALLETYLATGWTLVSETVTPGHFKGDNACCLTAGGFALCGPCGAPAGLAAGRTSGTINVTLRRQAPNGGDRCRSSRTRHQKA